MKAKSIFVKAFLFASTCLCINLRAANTWDGGDVDGNWGSILNWDDDLLPTFPVALTFAGTSQLSSTNDQTGAQVNGITFSSGAGAFTIAGNEIILAGNIVNNSTSAQTLSLPLSLNANRTLTATSGNITLSGVVSGGFGITAAAGSNTIVLSGLNTYTGGTTISSGTLKLESSTTYNTAGPLGSGAGTLTSAVNSTLDLNGQNLAIRGLAASGTITVTSGVSNAGKVVNNSGSGTAVFANYSGDGTNTSQNPSVSFVDNTTGAGKVALAKYGQGQWQLNANAHSDYSGGMTIYNGSVRYSATFNFGTGPITFAGNTTVANSYGSVTRIFNPSAGLATVVGGTGSNNATIANAFVVNSGITGAIWNGFNGGTLTCSGSITGSGNLQVRSDGFNTSTLLSGDHSAFNGTVTLMAGNTAANTHNVRLTNTAGFPLAPISLISNSTTNTGNVSLQWLGNANATVPLGDLNTTGNSGTATLSLRNGTAGTTTFEVGSLGLSSTFSGAIQANGASITAIKKVGAGTWTLSGANTYTGATSVDAGTLNVTGSLGLTDVSVKDGASWISDTATFGSLTVNGNASAKINSTVLSNAAGLVVAGGSTAATRGTLNMSTGSIGTISVNGSAGTTIGGTAAGEFSEIQLDVGATLADNFSSGSQPITIDQGGAHITLTDIGVSAGQTYLIASSAAGITGAGFATGTGTTVGALTLTNPNIAFGVTATLNVTANNIEIVTTGSSAPSDCYWSGDKGTNWNSFSGANGNFTTSAGGSTFNSANPGASTNVYFSNNSPTNLTHSLGGNFSIYSLTYRASSAATITSGVGNQLTLDVGGITLESGNGGATLSMSTLVLADNQEWKNESANPLVVSANIVGTGKDLVLSGGGAIHLGGAACTFNSLALNTPLDVKGTSITSAILSSASAITNTGSSNATITNQVFAEPCQLSGIISDNGPGATLSLVKSGSDVLTLSGDNSFSGTVTIQAGTLVLGHDNALGNATGSTGITSGAAIDLNGHTTADSVSNVAGTGVASSGAIYNSSTTAAAITGITSAVGAFTVNTIGNITLSTISAASNQALTKVGPGTLILKPVAGVSNAVGNLLVNEGTVILAASGAAESAQDVIVAAGATVKMDPDNQSTSVTPALFFDGQIHNAITLNGGTFDLNGTSGVNNRMKRLIGTAGSLVTNSSATPANFSLNNRDGTAGAGAAVTATFAGNIQDGTGSVAVNIGNGGANWWTNIFSGTNTYSGDTIISDNILQAGSTTALSPNSSVSLGTAANATLALNGFDNSIGALGGGNATGGKVTLGSATLTIGENDQTATYDGVISGTGGVIKSGSGAQTFNRAQTYTGDTSVKEGVLSISTAYFADSASVRLTTGAELYLSFEGTDQISQLFIDGVAQATGTWGAIDSGADHESELITGTGILRVGAGFTSWISGTFTNGTLAPGDQDPTDDADGDGLNNALEYAFAGNDPTVGNGSIGTLTGTTVTFNKRAIAVANGDVTYGIESSTDLVTWNPVAPTVNDASILSYTFTPSGQKDFFRAKITLAP